MTEPLGQTHDYKKNIWALCEGEQQIKELKAFSWRVVEAQHKSSTRKLVNSLEEHEILETLIERSKPKLAQTLQDNLHYLLFSPFRYPPLKYGSRFGRPFEPSLWYGALELDTALAEVAFYRLVFLHDTETDLGYIKVLLTAYSVDVHTPRGLDLTILPFKKHSAEISSITSYEHSQALGSLMRSADVEAFTYFSARSPTHGINIGIFKPTVFVNNKPHTKIQTWECIANKSAVEFRREEISKKNCRLFPADLFTVDRRLIRLPV